MAYDLALLKLLLTFRRPALTPPNQPAVAITLMTLALSTRLKNLPLNICHLSRLAPACLKATRKCSTPDTCLSQTTRTCKHWRIIITWLSNSAEADTLCHHKLGFPNSIKHNSNSRAARTRVRLDMVFE
jgi:hypothetical protein